MPLPVEHNVENYAYLIEHEEIGKLVFCTDAISFPYKIKNVNHLLIEANYSDDLIIDHLCENQDIRSNNQYHMEISDTIKCINNNYTCYLNNIVTIHLSYGQSDEELFKNMIFEETGIRPVVAEEGLTININKELF